jgi:type III secretion protein J
MRWQYRLLFLSAALLLSGCKVDLYSSLSEADANQMLALLASSQIEGGKRLDAKTGLVLQVEKSDFVKAVEVLRQNGYPRRAWRTVDELFPTGQLVTSPAQEQAKIRYLREQSLERMLSNIEGVISANVVIADIPAEEGGQSSSEPSASVLVKYTPEVNLRALSAQLKKLIQNALPGVKQEHISMIVQAVDYRFAATEPASSASSVKPEPKAGLPESMKNESRAAIHPLSSQATATPSASSMAPPKSLPLWGLLTFWLVSSCAVIWHGLRKKRSADRRRAPEHGD